MWCTSWDQERHFIYYTLNTLSSFLTCSVLASAVGIRERYLPGAAHDQRPTQPRPLIRMPAPQRNVRRGKRVKGCQSLYNKSESNLLLCCWAPWDPHWWFAALYKSCLIDFSSDCAKLFFYNCNQSAVVWRIIISKSHLEFLESNFSAMGKSQLVIRRQRYDTILCLYPYPPPL